MRDFRRNPKSEPTGTAGTGASETARHYGNMRFAMFTVFTAILGALVGFVFSKAGSAFVHLCHQKLLVTIAGIALSVMFGLAEIRISQLVTHYQEASFSAGVLQPPKYRLFWGWVVLITMLLPYALSLTFWIMLAMEYITIPIVSGD
ncbi:MULTISPECIES: hypothetical protein [Methylomonas]|uniref:Uncharacterized protein n=1 Tax=Methylomonas koyamae TaxID=702114 RepID=A0A177P4S2_9GAMM|nr:MULTISPECIES: hypothetical protein [Methylomonas]OAI25082.1 hypothetical protein A1355_20135 [Methylomonas koyamae]OHX37836.1 hypothetical protein BJL95_04490 [Methylomonas sp. LWB]